jgi:hypothetical protein
MNIVGLPGTVTETLAKVNNAHAEGRVTQVIVVTLDESAKSDVYFSNANAMQMIFMAWCADTYVRTLCDRAGVSPK